MACKQWWRLPASETEFNPTLTNPPNTTAHTYLHIDYHEVEDAEGNLNWNFVHKRCFHCVEPTCVSVCPVAAMRKNENGPVTWDEARCIGCRYCAQACPFRIPKYEFDDAWAEVGKCWFCWDRIAEGLQPACAKACPPKAIEFGEREAVLAEAHRRIEENPGKYVDYVYGENEAGGTSLFYISPVPFEELGFNMDVPHELLPELTWEFLTKIPIEALAIVTIMSGIWYVRGRMLRGKPEPIEEEEEGHG
jgi:formate dehydrogenase iron-sulfur subunit